MNLNSDLFLYTFYSLIGLLSITMLENVFTNNLLLYNKLQNLLNNLYNKIKIQNELLKEHNNTQNETIIKKIELKYEYKYIDFIQNTNSEYIFTEDEKTQILDITESKFNDIKNTYQENMKNFYDKLNVVKNDIEKLNNITNDEFNSMFDNGDYESLDTDCFVDVPSKSDIIDNKNKELINIENDIAKIQKVIDDELTIKKEAELYANNFIVNKRLEKINGCFVMEYTPLGNVLMTYNKDKTSFIYYSDSTIPYRYLEVVGRKFVKTYNCRPIFIDMEEELKIYEKKLEDFEEEKKKNLQKNEELQKNEPQNKNVFAKLKNYNKPSGKISSVPPPNNNTNNMANENRKFILKENANRYTYNGKISTFNPLKKVERKAVDKKYAMTFADFKKLQMTNFFK